MQRLNFSVSSNNTNLPDLSSAANISSISPELIQRVLTLLAQNNISSGRPADCAPNNLCGVNGCKSCDLFELNSFFEYLRKSPNRKRQSTSNEKQVKDLFGEISSDTDDEPTKKKQSPPAASTDSVKKSLEHGPAPPPSAHQSKKQNPAAAAAQSVKKTGEQSGPGKNIKKVDSTLIIASRISRVRILIRAIYSHLIKPENQLVPERRYSHTVVRAPHKVNKIFLRNLLNFPRPHTQRPAQKEDQIADLFEQSAKIFAAIAATFRSGTNSAAGVQKHIGDKD